MYPCTRQRGDGSSGPSGGQHRCRLRPWSLVICTSNECRRRPWVLRLLRPRHDLTQMTWQTPSFRLVSWRCSTVPERRFGVPEKDRKDATCQASTTRTGHDDETSSEPDLVEGCGRPRHQSHRRDSQVDTTCPPVWSGLVAIRPLFCQTRGMSSDPQGSPPVREASEGLEVPDGREVSVGSSGTMAVKWIATILILCAAGVSAGEPTSRLKVELRKPEDSASVTSAATSTVIAVTSKSGIGGGRIVRGEPQWPARLVVRLDLKGLESLRMDNGAIHIDTSLKGPAKTPYWKTGKSQRPAEQPDGTMELRVTQSEGHVEVVVPKEMTEGNREAINVAWIDFFRQ